MADQLIDAGWNRSRHVDLRQRIANHIAANPSLYKDIIVMSSDTTSQIPSSEESNIIFSKYVDRISRPGELGDAICILAFTRIVCRDVIVHVVDTKSNGLSNMKFEVPDDVVGRRGKACHLGWYPSVNGVESGNHYFSILPPSYSSY